MLITTQEPLLEEKRRLELEVVAPETPVRLMVLVLQPTLFERIKMRQVQDLVYKGFGLWLRKSVPVSSMWMIMMYFTFVADCVYWQI